MWLYQLQSTSQNLLMNQKSTQQGQVSWMCLFRSMGMCSLGSHLREIFHLKTRKKGKQRVYVSAKVVGKLHDFKHISLGEAICKWLVIEGEKTMEKVLQCWPMLIKRETVEELSFTQVQWNLWNPNSYKTPNLKN